MNELTLTELDMGSATPRILGASKPCVDWRGKSEISCKNRNMYTRTPTHTHNMHTLKFLVSNSVFSPSLPLEETRVEEFSCWSDYILYAAAIIPVVV